MFELKHRDGLARICALETAHGTVETPVLLPVINPNRITISPAEMEEEFGIRALITNSYIIRRDPELREAALDRGLHELVGFRGTIMTDSGTFQSHMYGEVELDPGEIVDFQRDIGSDIGTVLDIFSEPEDGRRKVERDLDITIERAGAAAGRKGDMLLAGPVQGGRFPDLRERAAREMSALACDVFPIGGVVPMMERQMYPTLVNSVLSAKAYLDPARPVHLFGCGHPMIFSLAALMGCDMLDSSAYAKFARDGRMMFPDGTRSIDEMRELPCHCPVCSGRTAAELRGSPDREKLMAMHNLHVSFSEIRAVKQAIHEGRIWELTETRCRAHPRLLEALGALKGHMELLERHEPLSRDLAFLYTSPESYQRPAVVRLRERVMERFSPGTRDVDILFPEGTKPYSRTYAEHVARIRKLARARFWVDSLFCPVPLELDGVYPVSQSVVPWELDQGTLMEKERHLDGFIAAGLLSGGYMEWRGRDTLNAIPAGRPDMSDTDLARVRAVADYQFGRGAGDALLDGRVELVKSPRTGRIRNILLEGAHVLSMRAGDGLFTLKLAGGEVLRKAFPPPRSRVIVDRDSAGFNRRGKSVFCGFVLDADPGLVPGDEVLIVDEGDELCAVGRTILTRDEMMAFEKGIAVKVREGAGAEPVGR